MNIVWLRDHNGRHTNKYHAWVYRQLDAAIGDSTGDVAKTRLYRELFRIYKLLDAEPRLPYTDGPLK
jgi:hypothetical protein